MSEVGIREFVLDTSALLAFIKNETGAEKTHAALLGGAICSAANWSELAQKVRQSGKNWDNVRKLLKSFRLTITDVTEADAETAAALWKAGNGLSLGDRLCLALAERMGTDALTTDRAWVGAHPRAQLIR